MTSRAKTLPGLTGLRGVACCWVLLYHFEQSGSTPFAAPLPVLRHGYLGVDVFFLLSGFVLFHVYDVALPGGFSLAAYRDFLRARLARIYPLHLASLLLVLLLVLVLPGFAAPFAGKPAQFAPGTFLENLLLVQNWVPRHQTSWNTPAWSLSAEWFAYVAFPLVLVATRAARAPGVAVGLAFAAMFAVAATLAGTGKSLAAAGPVGLLRLAGEFSAGALLCRAQRLGLRVAPLACLGSAVPLLWAGLRHAGEGFACLAAFPLILLSAAAPRGPLAWLLARRPFVVAGEISFSVYMLHWVALTASNALLPGHPLAPGALALWNTGLLAVIVTASLASWRWIEIPARAWGRRLGTAAARRPAALAVLPPG